MASGSAVPTQLVLVPMLFLAPVATVPILVVLGYSLGLVVDVATGRVHAERIAVVVAGSWHCLGPVAVLLAAGEAPPGPRRLADLPGRAGRTVRRRPHHLDVPRVARGRRAAAHAARADGLGVPRRLPARSHRPARCAGRPVEPRRLPAGPAAHGAAGDLRARARRPDRRRARALPRVPRDGIPPRRRRRGRRCVYRHPQPRGRRAGGRGRRRARPRRARPAAGRAHRAPPRRRQDPDPE